MRHKWFMVETQQGQKPLIVFFLFILFSLINQMITFLASLHKLGATAPLKNIAHHHQLGSLYSYKIVGYYIGEATIPNKSSHNHH